MGTKTKTQDPLKKYVQGCPNCGSKELNYDTFDIDGNEIWYPFECLKCGFRGIEYCRIEFVEFGVKENPHPKRIKRRG